MNRIIVGIAGLVMAAGTASAAFLGIQVREDKVLPPGGANVAPGIRVFNIYAKFDGPGTASGPGRVNTVLSVGQANSSANWGINLTLNPGSNFNQSPPSTGATASNVGGPDLDFGNNRALYDTWVSIGLKYQDSGVNSGNPPIADNSAGDPDFAMQNTDSIAGPASFGLAAGHDHIKGGWNTTNPPALQGAAKSAAGKFEVFLAQIAIVGLLPTANGGQNLNPNAALSWVNTVFEGGFIVFRQGDTSIGEPPAVGIPIQFKVPTPGALSLFGVAGLLAARRRR